MLQKKKYNTELVNTIIGEDCEVKGSLHSQRSIRVEGTLEGEINSQGEVFIGVKSKVKANIIARRITICGEVIGNIEAIDGLEILESGRVYGDITGNKLMIEEGAIYKGKVNMDIIAAKNLYEGKVEYAK